MSHHSFHHDSTAARGQACAGAAWVDSGTGLGLVVMDSNRPAIGAGSARGLLEQPVAAHQ